jgi:hypothetical protein
LGARPRRTTSGRGTRVRGALFGGEHGRHGGHGTSRAGHGCLAGV